MKKFKVSGILFLTFMCMLVVTAGMLITSVTEMGNTANAAVTQHDCRYCHDGINPGVEIERRCSGTYEICLTDANCAVGEYCVDVAIKNRHHILTGAIGAEGPANIPPTSLIFDGLCSMNDTVFCHDDEDCPDFASGETCKNYSCSINETVLCDDDAQCPEFASGETCRNYPITDPYPRATPTDPDRNRDAIRDTIYGCNNCHPDDPDTAIIEFTITRNCILCHYPKDITSATVRDGLITIRGSGFDAVTESNIVLVERNDGGSCPTDVVSWSDSLIEAYSSWLWPDGSVCVEPGQTVIVPCAAAEKMISGETVDLDIARFRVSNSARIGSEIKRIQLTVENPNGGAQDMRRATLIGVQNGMEVYNQTRMVFDLSGNGRSRFAFPSFTPSEAGDINWTVEIHDDDPDDDTATASTNVK